MIGTPQERAETAAMLEQAGARVDDRSIDLALVCIAQLQGDA